LHGGYQRPQLGVVVERVADGEPRGGLFGDFGGFRIARLGNQQTGQRQTGLTGIQKT
jgi:hypothetical protein